MMSINVVLLLLGLAILTSLAMGLYFLCKDTQGEKRTLYALTWRVGFTLVMLFILLLGIAMGWLTPHPVGA